MPEFQRGPIVFEGDGSIDLEKNSRGREEQDPRVLEKRIHAEVNDYLLDAKVNHTHADIERISDNMANIIGIGYWDGKSNEYKKHLIDILRGIPDMDKYQATMVFEVLKKLRSRNEVKTPDLDQAA